MATVNKVRLFLTSIGYFVAVFIFALGVIILDSYYNSQFSVIEESYPFAVVLKKGDYDATLRSNVFNYRSGKTIMDYIAPTDDTLLSQKTDIGGYFSLLARFHYISEPTDVLSEVSDENDFLPIKRSLIEGRFFDSSDYDKESHSIIIDKCTAEILFNGESAIGKTVKINSTIGEAVIYNDNKSVNDEYTVVGVVATSNTMKYRWQIVENKYLSNNQNIILHTSVWTPFLEHYEYDSFSICYFEDENEYNDYSQQLERVKYLIEAKGENQYISTKSILIQSKIDDLSTIQTGLNLIEIILVIVTGISIMGVTFFSVKERIPEIGIRKAFGASRADIVFQFMFETVIIAFISSIISVFLAFIVCKFFEPFFSTRLLAVFKLHVNYNSLLLPIAIGILEAVLCSCLPSIYGSRIKVTSALKFE